MGVPGEFSHVVRTHKMLYPSLLFLNPARPGTAAAKMDIYLPACSDDALSRPLNSWPRLSHFPRRGISYRGKGEEYGGGRGGLRSSGGMKHVGMTVWRDTQGTASKPRPEAERYTGSRLSVVISSFIQYTSTRPPGPIPMKKKQRLQWVGRKYSESEYPRAGLMSV